VEDFEMATTSVKKAVGNIADSVYYGISDSAGYLNGATETAPSAGDADGSAMAQLLGVQNFPFEGVDADRPSQKGDGGVLVRFINKPTELPQSDLVFGASDYDFYALIQSLKVVALGGGEFVLGQPYNPVFRDLMFLAVAPAKSIETASLDSALWEARLILKAQISPKHRNAFNSDGLPTYPYSLISNYAACYPWGHAFSDADEGDVKAAFIDFTWPYKPMVQRWTGNNTLAIFNLAYAIAEDSADNIIAFVDGVEQTWVTASPSAGEFGITTGTPDTIEFGTVPGSDAKIVALFGRT
jgi:hypothetical protein